jgi:hypothetical protein
MQGFLECNNDTEMLAGCLRFTYFLLYIVSYADHQKLVLFQVTCPPGTVVEKGLTTLHHCRHHSLLFPTAFSPPQTERNSSSSSSWHAGRCRLPLFLSTRRQQLLRRPQLPSGRTTATAGQLLLCHNINLR